MRFHFDASICPATLSDPRATHSLCPSSSPTLLICARSGSWGMLRRSAQINDESSDKVLEVERQYNEVRRPVFARRGEVIAKVPDFWGTAFINHPFFRDILSEQDEEALTYLSKVSDAKTKQRALSCPT